MPILIMWQNVKIGVLFGNAENIKYKIFFENLPEALNQGLILRPILNCITNGMLPIWINNRIPETEPDKLDYLKRTEGRLETDDFWFLAA